MAREADSESSWLHFVASHEMQALLNDNLFATSALMDDSSFAALLSLPSQQTMNVGGAGIFDPAEDGNVNFRGDWQQMHSSGGLIEGNLAGVEPGRCDLAVLPSDPGLVERAAKYSCFAQENCRRAEESGPSTTDTVTSCSSKEKALDSTLSGKDSKCYHPKKRKSVQKAVNSEPKKGKSSRGVGPAKDAVEESKCQAEQSDKYEEKKTVKASPPPPEMSNYIHVRARRGQATDSHSLAERLRREKISERMKLLQDLVPGCSKITGKASMLDEIINHVQCLQRQVEFLSMKLATVNPRFDFEVDRFSPKDIMTFCPRNPPSGGISTELTTSPYLPFPQLKPSMPQHSLPWNSNTLRQNVLNSEFHPAIMQLPFDSQVNSGNFLVKREM
ncbi:hypothetical protein SUGI_0415360 [Cryptomeria japonica]|uniref:basic helix-loop-helix protein 80 n=1 Tax=Cryptomeria japonica TaxID=3369 RepID=UPI002408E102|nr:basic helix-loop-helix protein 80 [Cryptomeria japonica]GLJ22132.1 hypothetical protein SUGI_0415360 [Cryptomeria japonica]